ncbi:PucR family transcriptional regulator [Nocardioides nitrophenolicus]|uniref:PucR family transcriptional regulator n=1 Tax=Nocardioides nitrophenolicus TaxID=60489 RepID=UPI0019596B4B|nr:helix-turn-helix domain-containing protein [Nocardioides nitrophenolicus]MBM7517104.1 DNA-binding PucR family transcriptional regulator [Nocardioides nitrophenolicus]
MAEDELQAIVDELAERLERSVAIDDPGIRLLAASRHFGDEDPVRIDSVLNRTVPPEIVEQILTHGVAQWTEPGRLELGMHDATPRLCAPVRCQGQLLGYLWLLDRGGTLSDADVAAAVEAAERAGTVLYRRLLVRQRSQARHESILRDLVSPDTMIRSQAIDDLRAEELFPDSPLHLAVLAVQCLPDGEPLAEREVELEAAVEEGSRAVPDVALLATNPSRAWLLLALRRPPTRELVDAVTDRIAIRFKHLTRGRSTLVFGLGPTVERLDEVADSYRKAVRAARTAVLVPGVGTIARWGELGPYELLVTLAPDDLAEAARTPDLVALEEADVHGVLIATLTTFFDLGGSAQEAADALCIHRATLYQRLRRIEQVTGRSLQDGDDRLALHLGLKLRALALAFRVNADCHG